MTKEEIEMALESLFSGAARVRARKHKNKLTKNIHRQFTARILNQMNDEEKKHCKAA